MADTLTTTVCMEKVTFQLYSGQVFVTFAEMSSSHPGSLSTKASKHEAPLP